MSSLGSIGIIGCGAMGAAIARAVINAGVVSSTSLVLVEKVFERVSTLSAQLGASVRDIGDSRLAKQEIVVLAVKPQDAASVCEAIRLWIRPEQLVISIMAGVTLGTLSDRLNGHVQVIRSMPNLPAQIGVGVTAYYAASSVLPLSLQRARRIFESFGTCVLVQDEKLIDVATAISGSGPAYFYFLLQQMQIVAQELGLSLDQAQILLKQTMKGACALWEQTAADTGELIAQVSSRGGTTEAAFNVLAQHEVAAGIREAIKAAHVRARSLAS